jgi:hypothetical protein
MRSDGMPDITFITGHRYEWKRGDGWRCYGAEDWTEEVPWVTADFLRIEDEINAAEWRGEPAEDIALFRADLRALSGWE